MTGLDYEQIIAALNGLAKALQAEADEAFRAHDFYWFPIRQAKVFGVECAIESIRELQAANAVTA